MSAENCKRCGKPQKFIGPRCECDEPDGRAHCAVATGSGRFAYTIELLKLDRKHWQNDQSTDFDLSVARIEEIDAAISALNTKASNGVNGDRPQDG